MNLVLLKDLLEGVSCVAFIIIAHEHTEEISSSIYTY